MAQYRLPDVGEGLTEADIVSWMVAVGDTIAINDIVVEIETAKSLVELPSPYAGVVTALLVPEGTTVDVGTPIIDIQEPGQPKAQGETSPPVAETSLPVTEESLPVAEESLSGANLVGYGPREASLHRRQRRTTSAGPAATEASRALAKPPVRLLAKQLGVDLGSVVATGTAGDVRREDVEAAARPAATSTPEVTQSSDGRERREPIRGVRKVMANAMVGSAFSAPHVSVWITVDVTPTMDLVAELKTRDEFSDVRVSPLLILAKACLQAMRRTPEINSAWDDDAGEVVFKRYVNLGIAAATPRGLVVPNIKDAQDLTLPELGRALNSLTVQAREGRTTLNDMSGGTFTITNVGIFGVDAGTPIINPGESAILAFGATNKRPWVVSTAGGDALAIRQVTTLAMSFDHRHIDGAMGSRFLADVAALLANPSGLTD